MRSIEMSGLDDSEENTIQDLSGALDKVRAAREVLGVEDEGSGVADLEAAVELHGREVRAARLKEIKKWYYGTAFTTGGIHISGEDVFAVIGQLIAIMEIDFEYKEISSLFDSDTPQRDSSKKAR